MGTCFRRPNGRSRSSSWRTTLAHRDSTPTSDYWRPSCWPSRAATSWRSATGADVHERCDNANRRLCNQAFFIKIYIDEDDQLRVENNRPFEMLLDPQINANALTWAQDSNKARTETIQDGKGSSLVRGVEHRGFEPLTSSMPWKRATNCANAPGGLSAPCGRLD